jgi:hypothetical protein
MQNNTDLAILACTLVALKREKKFMNFMKPYNRAILKDEKTIFNYRLSRARRVVENVFGVLTKRFKIFQREIRFEPNKARKIIFGMLSSAQLLEQEH